MVYVMMGVSGSGKTFVGEALAEKLGVPFYDGDQFHPPANVAKMKASIPLDDSDREEAFRYAKAAAEMIAFQFPALFLATPFMQALAIPL